jgi:glycosyltransferase involved in cell wall biosynthesis
MKKISNHTFVILGYKTFTYFDECMASLLNQTVQSKIIMTSSRINDESRALAAKYNIPLIGNDLHLDFSGDLNAAYKAADTEYMTFMHQDDWIEPDYLELTMQAAEKYPDASMVFTNYKEFRDGKFITTNLNMKIKNLILAFFYNFSGNIKNKFWKKLSFAFGNPVLPATILFNKKLCCEIIFDSIYKVSPEWDIMVKLSEKPGRFVLINKPLYIYRLQGGLVSAADLVQRAFEDRLIFEQLWPKPIANAFCRFYKLCYKNIPE